MQTIVIDLSDTAARRLREQAAQQNSSVEAVAAQLLSARLEADLGVSDEALAVIQEAVDEVRFSRQQDRP